MKWLWIQFGNFIENRVSFMSAFTRGQKIIIKKIYLLPIYIHLFDQKYHLNVATANGSV